MSTIGIDYTAAYEQGAGIGRYVRELVRALAAQDAHSAYRLFVAGAYHAALPAAPGPNFAWRPTRITPLWFARLWHRAQVPLPVETFTGRLSLYHATDFTLPPTLPGTRTLLTVHDLSFVRAPETSTPVLKAYLDKVVPRSVKRADHVLADSKATKDDLVALYGTAPEKITVLLSGVDARFQPVEDADARRAVRERYNIPDGPYIFSVGTVQPRKNYARLAEALAALGPRYRDVRLVIAGGRGWLDSPIYRTIEALDLGERVLFTGFARDEDLPALYSDAVCVAYPSLYEGFGFPVLEGMACGTPVLASTVSSIPEVAGDAAILVDPYDVDAIRDGMERLLSDESLRTDLVARGRTQAQQFTWARSAQHLEQVYHMLLG
ncbi:MAG TPA: glycosyltransferase family 1 protein [Aggregatilinea sp.]|uniref:glycosyltransferase family 4 protein n=1 Tax=Aggregatilinea sp. TaxID=2806333 RepID=UPI002BFF0B04|nr:glycosyltransferase family 1 protein [Aggregatilinea sp.]HML21258.1 glycosyltransferase family 1 protein [Aggregatilinea sp.]